VQSHHKRCCIKPPGLQREPQEPRIAATSVGTRQATRFEGFTPPVFPGEEGWDIPAADSWKYCKIQCKNQTDPRTPFISSLALAQQEKFPAENNLLLQNH